MGVSLTSEPIINVGISNKRQSGVNAGRSQLPYLFTCTDFLDKTNYKVNIEIYESTGTTLLFSFALKYSPKSDGSLFVDLHKLITEYHEANNLKTVRFRIKYWETYEGFTGSKTQSSTIMSVYGFVQIGMENGTNLVRYLPNDVNGGVNFDPDHLGNPATLFNKPKIWEGFKRSFSIIVDSISSTIFSNDFDLDRDFGDINGNALAEPTVTDTISKDTPGVIETNIGFSTTPTNGKSLIVSTTENGGDSVYSNKTFWITQECSAPLYLEWQNSLGAFEQYLFQMRQVVRMDYEEGLRATKGIYQDYASTSQTKIRLAPTWTQVITLEADGLTLNDLLALSEIKQSSTVRILLNKGGSFFVQVVVSGLLTTGFNTKDNSHSIQIEIELPDNYNVFDTIEYEGTGSAHLSTAFSSGFN